MNRSDELITVEIAYAAKDKQSLIPIKVRKGTTVEAAIKLSGILEKFPEIDLTVNQVGIFGKFVPLTRLLKPVDRVEIYRPLIADAKKARRERASKSKV